MGIRSQGSVLYEWDDFVSGRSNADQTFGKLGWNMFGGGAAILAPVAGRPGIARITANNQVSWLGYNLLGAFVYGDTFDVLWIFRPTQIDANTKFRIGTVSGAERSNDPPAAGIYFENLNESTWFAVTRTGGTQTRTDTTATATAGNWYVLRVRRIGTGANIEFTVNGGSTINHTANIPTATDAMVWASVVSTAVADKTGDADWADLLITGLSR